MIIFDFETDGFLQASVVDLKAQPKATEFAAIKLCDEALKRFEYKEVDRLTFLINPKRPLPKKITELTGIKDEDLVDQPEFSHFFPQLVQFFFGEKYLIAHNIAFDMGIMRVELMRLGRLMQFPYPPIQICTVNQTIKMKGFRLKLGDLYQHLFGEPMKQAHRAMIDVEHLAKIVVELVKTGVIKL